MREEENKVLEYFKDNQVFDIEVAFNYIPVLLNIIEGLQTKVDTGIEIIKELKEIEKSHKEENGKLRVEFEKVYEDNLTLAHELERYKMLEANIDKANKIIAENKFDEDLYGLLMQEKEKGKELNEALERSSGRVTELTVENSDLKYQIYYKQQMIDELTQNEEKLKIELGKEKEKNKDLEEKLKIAVAMLTKGTYPEKSKGDNDFDKYFISKDKIMELLENEIIDISEFRCIAVEDLEELLEEK